MTKRTFVAVIAACSALVASAPAVSAASLPTGDARWNAWYGCWRPEALEGVTAPAHVICVLPASGESVSIATIANGKIVSEESITADGARHETNAGGCKGFETASWSKDARRVFTRSDLNCGGDVRRVSTGILALISTGSYVDVQTVDVGGEKASRTVRYIALPEAEIPSIVAGRLENEALARESSRVRAAAPLDFEDVVEATREVGSETIDGLLVARRAGFKLSASTLRTLVAEGVQPSTVDVMVALSYPKEFAVAEKESRNDGERNPWRADNGRRGDIWSSCYDDFGPSRAYGYDPYTARYSRCGYNSFYSPYGYDPYGWGYGTRQVVVVKGGGSSDDTDDTNGALVKGKGYTRRGEATGSARPRETPTTQRTGSTSTGGSTSTVRSGGSTGSSSTGSKGSTASGGSSSSGTSTTRSAKPKGGG